MATARPTLDKTFLDAAPIKARGLRSFPLLGGYFRIQADSQETNGAFSLVEFSGATGSEPPLHTHSREDELFYVIEGELSVRRGFESLVVPAGQSAFLPRNVPHTFKIVSDSVRVLVLITPGGFEEYFRTLGTSADGPFPSPARMVEVAARHGVTFLS